MQKQQGKAIALNPRGIWVLSQVVLPGKLGSWLAQAAQELTNPQVWITAPLPCVFSLRGKRLKIRTDTSLDHVTWNATVAYTAQAKTVCTPPCCKCQCSSTTPTSSGNRYCHGVKLYWWLMTVPLGLHLECHFLLCLFETCHQVSPPKRLAAWLWMLPTSQAI